MKKDVFADWLRELCMLVFIQTVQAFIFAIVMSLIISVLSDFPDDATDAVASTGVIAVIVLASVSKIEEIVKKIFGIKSGFHDSGMRGGLKSLATTMMAAGLAKGVLDNFGKIGSGIAGAIGSSKQIGRARARMSRDLTQFGGGSKAALGAGGTGVDIAGAGADAAGVDAAVAGATAAGAAAAGAAGKGKSSSSDAAKLQEKIDAYNDKIRELRSKRRKSVIQGISGLNETALAIGGGAVGMAAGAAVGEGKEIIQGGLAGMGAGDFAGRVSVQPLTMVNGLRESIGELADVRKDQKELAVNMSRVSASAKDAIAKKRTIITKANAASKELDKMLKQIDAGNMDL